MQTRWSRKVVRGDVYLVELNVNNAETQVTRKPLCYQWTGINISIRVIFARSGLPAEIFFAFIVVVCIVTSLYIVLFSVPFPSFITSCTQYTYGHLLWNLRWFFCWFKGLIRCLENSDLENSSEFCRINQSRSIHRQYPKPLWIAPCAFVT